MVIRNETKKTIVSTNALKAKTFKQKAFGLLLAKQGTTMLFQTRFGIHTFFMKYPIDVLVLDKENKVTKIKENLKANTIFVWKPIYSTLIEMPGGSIKQTRTQINDTIKITDS